MPLQASALHIRRHVVAIVIEPGFTDSPHARMPRQERQFFEIVVKAQAIGVNTHGCKDVIVSRGHCEHRGAISSIHGRRQQATDSSIEGTGNGGAGGKGILVEEMCMRVDVDRAKRFRTHDYTIPDRAPSAWPDRQLVAPLTSPACRTGTPRAAIGPLISRVSAQSQPASR